MKKDYLLKKWLIDRLSDSELEDFKKSDNYSLNSKIVEKAAHFDIPDTSVIKNYDDFKRDLGNQTKTIVKLRSYKMLYRIAGLFVIGIGIYFLFFFNNLTTIRTLASQKITFELPDASKVILNADSHAQYNKKKWTDKRDLLLDGEAFFKVAKGSKFNVVTSGGTVSVLGTQFNVKNRVDYFEVKCFEGIVAVSRAGKKHELAKGKTYRILNNIIVLDSVAIQQPNWIDNISTFKGVPLYVVIEEFERQYDVEIETVKINTRRIFTGSFANDDLEQALKSITVPFNITYRKSNSNKISLYKSEQ